MLCIVDEKTFHSFTKNCDDKDLYNISHPSEVITHAIGRVMGGQLTDLFKPCEDFSLRKAKNGCICKKTVSLL